MAGKPLEVLLAALGAKIDIDWTLRASAWQAFRPSIPTPPPMKDGGRIIHNGLVSYSIFRFQLCNFQQTDAAHPNSSKLSITNPTVDPIELAKSSCSGSDRSANL
jgi:hypothetical protein